MGFAKRLAVAAAAWGLVAACISVRADVVLVDGGQPRAVIVIGADPSPQAEEAARVLQENVERISGVRLPIQSDSNPAQGVRVLVGRSAAVDATGIQLPSGYTPQLNEEGFLVKTLGNDLILAGNEDGPYRGTLFAVYDFLEQELGCRWFFPGPFGEVIPAMQTMRINDTDRTENPSFRIRDIWYSGWQPTNDDDRRWITEWYDRNKLNKLNLNLPGDGSTAHLAPADKYFDTRPEIYAMDEKGERMRDMLCMSEPEAVHIAAETIKAAFREDPNRLSFGFAPPDGHPMCYCDRCKSHFPGFMGFGYGDPSLSDLWFEFANNVAVEVNKEFPDRWVLTNGYANRVRPPETVKPLAPNLGIQSAVISACTIHRTGDPACWQRQLYEQVMTRWLRDLDFVIVYDYDPGKSLEGLPFPALHCIAYDLPWLHKQGLWGFWTEGNNSWMITHLNYYVRAKLMWDVDSDVPSLVHDYCVRFYGAAAQPVEDYIWVLDEAVECSITHETWGRVMLWRPILAPVIDQLCALAAEAEKRAVDSPFRERVRVLRLVHDHMAAFLAAEEAAGEGDFAKAVAEIDRMLVIRSETGKIQSGLLPETNELGAGHSSSAERLREHCASLLERMNGTHGTLVTMLPREWNFKTDPQDSGTLYEWYQPNVESGWRVIDTTLNWEIQGLQDERGWPYAGPAWYRTQFDIPVHLAGKPLRLALGGVYNDGVWVWVNGILCSGEGTRGRRGLFDDFTPIDYDVTNVVRPGEPNTVAVLVHTEPPGRNPRSGLHRRAFLWSPK